MAQASRSGGGWELKFGTVSGAVLAVLAEARGPLRYIEIHARVVELRLDTPIEKGSVKAFLSAEATRRTPRFICVRRGLYQLAPTAERRS